MAHFAKIDQNNVILQIVEKNPISRNALMGIHFWKNGKDFISSSNELLNTFFNSHLSIPFNFILFTNLLFKFV